MERLNSEGIPRAHLKWVLGERRFVMTARHVDSCLLCKRPNVSEAGLCQPCMAMLDDPEELRLVDLWMAGGGP